MEHADENVAQLVVVTRPLVALYSYFNFGKLIAYIGGCTLCVPTHDQCPPIKRAGNEVMPGINFYFVNSASICDTLKHNILC